MDIPYEIQMINAVIAHPAAYVHYAQDDQCFKDVVASARVHPAVLMAYQKTEGAFVGHIRHNENNTFDVEPMQINSIHWEVFYKDYAIEPLEIRFNGCINLMAGAKIIRDKFDAYGHQQITDWEIFYQAAADYHSRTPELNKRYQKIWSHNLNTILESASE